MSSTPTIGGIDSGRRGGPTIPVCSDRGSGQGRRAEKLSVERALAFLLVLVVSVGQIRATENSAIEPDVKAAFLFNFAKFISWPPESFETKDSPLKLGVLGTDPFGSSLDALDGRSIQDRRIKVVRLGDSREAESCHMVFLSLGEGRRLSAALAALKGRPVVTVSESPDFLERGGVIRLYTHDRRVRFDINPEVVSGSGLRISSQLLRLAQVVRSGP